MAAKSTTFQWKYILNEFQNDTQKVPQKTET